MKPLFTFLFSALSLLSFSQQTIVQEIDSEELQISRNIKIHLPVGYDKDSVTNYPLAIVLDDESLFDLYKGNASLFASKDNAPKQIVVGIDMKESRQNDTSFLKGSGNLTEDSKKFLRFIRDEVLLSVESDYRTSPFITIIGEGMAGNLITHFLKEKTPIFNAFICLNPTLNDAIVEQITSSYLKRYKMIDNTFYFYISSFGSDESRKRIKIKQLATYLTSLELKNFNTVFDDFKKSPSLVSSISEGIPRAFASIFEVFSGITKQEFDSNIKDLSPLDAISYLENKYAEIDFLFGANIGIRVNDIFAIEKLIIEKENGDYLRNFGEMILGIYPDSHLGNYYLGRYYESGKQYLKALKHYRIGYGKMSPSDPNSDKFYENVERVTNKN
jgi:predicted alpha/beta superfamily hydrolase